MSPAAVIVVFAVTWFLALYCLLPVGIRSQEEAGDDIPEGAMPGAPSKPHLRRKALGATVIACLVTAVAWYVLSNRLITLETVDRWLGFG